MNEGHVRVRSWEEFKRLVSEKKPGSLFFILEQNGFFSKQGTNIIKGNNAP
jgi:hypothetical protein